MKKYLVSYICFLVCQFCYAQTVLSVEGGQIKGSQQAGVRVFKGIPYAAPPVGHLRWKAPQALIPWTGVKDCQQFSASPMQDSPKPFMFWSAEFLIPEKPISEDCLYLNVWTPAKKSSEKLPVLVYIYGGGFRSGGSACPIYDGAAIANKGVIFVSINYRVGVFGFLAHPELSKESATGTSGNFALLDMQAALRWVQKNIEKFGGNPANVTIAGQSAGAFAVNYLVASPLSKGLFHKAIAQSGGQFYTAAGRPQRNLAQTEETGLKWGESIQCTSLAQLRAKSAEEIQKLQGNAPTWPIIDGYVIPNSIYEIFDQGKQNDVPTIVGWNADDKLFIPKLTKEAFAQQLEQRFGKEKAQAALQVYPATTDAEANQSAGAMSRDETFGVQDYWWAKMQSKTGKSPVFVYNFNRKLPAYSSETQFGAFHSGEIVYAYNNLHTLNRPWEDIDRSIADVMSSFWTNFAKTGNPNGNKLPTWQPFSSQHPQVMLLDTDMRCTPLPNQAQLDFW